MRAHTGRGSNPHRHLAIASVVVSGAVAGLVSSALPAAAMTVSVATETEYRNALTTLSGDNTGPHVIEVTADLSITGGTDPVYAGTQPLTINGNGHTISGGGTRRILEYSSGADLAINDLTVTQGAASTGLGGAITTVTADITVTNSTFSGNTASSGAAGLGGAIQSTSGDVTVAASTFSGNTASGSTAGLGGAIQATGGDVTATNSTFSGNTASSPAAALGGAIQATGGDVTATNSTLTGNTASSPTAALGGAIQNTGGDTALAYATVVENTAATGASLSIDDFTSFGSVVALPQGGGSNCSVNGVPTSNGFNFSDDTSCGFTGTGDTEDGPDPQLQALGAFGGPTETRAPEVTSPLVDAIPVGDCDPALTADQRGEGRPADGDSDGTLGCDIGAVELQPVAAPEPEPPAPTPEPVGPVAAAPSFTG